MKQYLNNKNYRMLYYDSFFKTFANGIYSVFTPVILYKSGVSITMIIFIYMIQFLTMGLFTPLAGTLSKKIGLANTKLLSYILKSISMFLVLNGEKNIIHYLGIAIIYGFSGAANNPLNTYIPSKIVKENFRGRFNSFTYILRCFSSIIGYILAGIFLIKDNNLAIIILVTFSYLIAYLALLNLDKSNLSYEIKSSFKESYKYLFNKNENKSLKKVSGLRSFIILERLIVVPLYLYISIMDLKTFTSLYVISTIIELLSLFISGNTFDKDKQRTFNIISIIKGLITAIFIFAKNTYILMINQSLYKLVDNVYDSSYSALSQSKVETDKKDTMLLSMIHEMCLCFYEFIVLFILMLISLINVNFTFKVMFIGSIIILFITARLVKKWNVEN